MATEATGIEEAAVETFAEKVLGDMAGAYTFFMAGMGDRLGLFKELATTGPATSIELAERTGLQERYLREWLGGMAAAGYLVYEPATTRYGVPAHHEPVLAEEAGPSFFGAAFFDILLHEPLIDIPPEVDHFISKFVELHGDTTF